MTTRMRTRGFRSNIAQMPGEEKTSWILNALSEIENLDDKLKILRRKIIKLHKENQELKDENQRLHAQLESNKVSENSGLDESIMDDVNVEHVMHTPSPPTPHLSPIKTDDLMKSINRKIFRMNSPRSRSRSRANKRGNRGGNKSRKLLK